MAASSAMLIVCLSGCDFMSILVVVWVWGFTMDAPSVGFPAFLLSVCIYEVISVPCRMEGSVRELFGVLGWVGDARVGVCVGVVVVNVLRIFFIEGV